MGVVCMRERDEEEDLGGHLFLPRPYFTREETEVQARDQSRPAFRSWEGGKKEQGGEDLERGIGKGKIRARK